MGDKGVFYLVHSDGGITCFTVQGSGSNTGEPARGDKVEEREVVSNIKSESMTRYPVADGNADGANLS